MSKQINRRTGKPSQKIIPTAPKVIKPRFPRRSTDQSQPGMSRAGFGPSPTRSSVGVSAAYSKKAATPAPQIYADRDSSRIVHRELVTNVSGLNNAGLFSVSSSLSLNPGLSATFPFLSSQAANWEQYRFNKLKFCYYTRCSTTTAGSVMLAPDYDAADSAPASEQTAASYESTQEDVPWKDIECTLRPAAMFPMGPKKYVRTTALSANQDIKTYDAGTLYVCTVDSSAAASWGKLWVEYDVTLYTPQIPPGGSVLQQEQHIASGTNTSASILGTQESVSGPMLVTVVNNVLTFNVAGQFFVVYNAGGTSVTNTANPVVSATGKLLTTFGSATGSGGPGYVTSGSTTAALTNSLLLQAVVGTTITYDYTVVGGDYAELYVVQTPFGSA